MIKRLSAVVAILLMATTLGCNHRAKSKDPTDPMAGIYEMNRGNIDAPDPIDEFFAQGGQFAPMSATMQQGPQEVGPYMAVKPGVRQAPPSPQSEPAPTVPMESPNLVAVAEAGPHHMSLIYPSSEYGIVKLDKVIPQEATLRQPFKYSIVVTNLTNTTLSNLVLTETLANHFDLKGTTPPAQTTAGRLVWKLDSLGPRAAERIEITGAPMNIEALKNCTALTYEIQACSNIRVVQPTLELIRKVPAEALLCDAIPIEYILKNTGSGSAQDVKITEALPNGLATVEGGTQIAFEVGTLRAGQSKSFTAEVRASKTGIYINRALATSSSNAQTESAATVIGVRQPVLVITKNIPDKLYLGRPLSYEITVINQGDGSAKDAVLEETIPSGVTGVEASAGADISGTKLTWNLGVIPANSSKTVRVSFKPGATGVFANTATANARCAQAVTSMGQTTVVGIPAVRIEVVDLEDPVEIGGTVTYVVTASNEGSAADNNLRLVCTLEDKLQYLSSTGATQASIMGRTISFMPLRSLAPNEKVTWRVIAKAISAGAVRFRVSLTSDMLTRPVEQTEATYLY